MDCPLFCVAWIFFSFAGCLQCWNNINQRLNGFLYHKENSHKIKYGCLCYIAIVVIITALYKFFIRKNIFITRNISYFAKFSNSPLGNIVIKSHSDKSHSSKVFKDFFQAFFFVIFVTNINDIFICIYLKFNVKLP